MEQSTQVARKTATRLPGRLMPRSFFEDPPERVAPRLLGKLLVHLTPTGVIAGRIVELEAYLGPHNQQPDPAAHTHRGLTPRNAVLFGPAGHAYVYQIYGLHFCMNISCETEGLAGGILLRALEPVAGLDLMAANRGLAADAPHRLLTSGPARLCEALDLTRPRHNGLDLTVADSVLQMRDDGCPIQDPLITVRIGIKHAADLPLRFVLPGHSCASGPQTLNRHRTQSI
jgi:DNA-3-methyladenine glycosylase